MKKVSILTQMSVGPNGVASYGPKFKGEHERYGLEVMAGEKGEIELPEIPGHTIVALMVWLKTQHGLVDAALGGDDGVIESPGYVAPGLPWIWHRDIAKDRMPETVDALVLTSHEKERVVAVGVEIITHPTAVKGNDDDATTGGNSGT